MSPTHDYILSNQSGASFRTDLNNALAAISSNNSNSSSPATTYAYQWWADTSAGILKLRNSANNAWIDMLNLDGTFVFDLEDGTSSAPSLRFADDTNTGIFSSGADKFNVTTGGIERLELGATTIFNEGGQDVDFRIESDGNANLFFLDAGNNRISIGTASPVSSSILSIQGGGNTSFSINTGNNSGDNTTINFGDSADADVGYINYDHGTNVLQFGVGATLAVQIDGSKRVMIGTTTEGHSAADDLTLATSGSTGITIRSGSSSEGNIYFSDATSGAGEYVGIIEYNHASNTLSFYAAGDLRAVVREERFEVYGEHSGNAVNNAKIRFNILDSNGNSKRAEIVSEKVSDIHSTLRFFTCLSNTVAERARIHQTGQFMIGTTDNNSALHRLIVSGDGTPSYFANGAGLLVQVTNSNDNHCVEFFQGRFNKRVLTQSHSNTGSVTFEVFEQADSNVGIITGNGSTTSFNTNPSDRSLKKNFEDWNENVLNLFKNINPQKFHFKQEEDTAEKSKGFIAQEMLESFPEAYPLVKDEIEKYYFNPSGMVVYLMKAIQELEAKVAALEAA